jgi:hypothetical protein
MSQATFLIVEQKQKAPESLPELLKELSGKYQLDIYQCRQKLVGRGLSLLARGGSESLEKVSALLQHAEYTHWLAQPSKPAFAPFKLRSITVADHAIRLEGVEKKIILSKGDRVLSVFADLSGSLADKSVQQLLSSHAYRGRDDIRHIEEEKAFKTILQGQPILDLYILDKSNSVTNAVRIFPGKFDPKGLGERATLSSKQNVAKVLEVVREYAGEFHLHTDFGLVNLPGCTLRTEDPDNPDTIRKNLISLTRYGWLMCDLLQTEKRPTQIEPDTTDDIATTITAAMMTMNPTLLAGEEAGELNQLGKEIAEEINAAENENPGDRIKGTVLPDPGLPAPPPAKATSAWTRPSFWFGTAGSISVMLLIIMFDNFDSPILRQIVANAFATGAIPLIAAGSLLWYGFYFLRMKRQIENTPTSRVRSVAMGMVEVKGKALRKYALISPMTHTPCVYYRLTKYRREKNNQWKVSSVSSSDNVPFLLEDDTGRVEIDPAGCRVSAGNKEEGTPGQVGFARLSNDSDDKWVEETIIDGTLIYVLGYAAVKRDSGPTMTERKVEALRELKRNPQKLQQFDTDGDGKISDSEWDAARASVDGQITRELLAEKTERKKQEEHIVIGKKQGHPLIITETHSEDHLTSRYLFYSIPLLIAAALATAGAIYFFVNYMKT